jgi:hypothetical protein
MNSAAGVRILNAPFRPVVRGATDAEGRVTLRDVNVGPSRVSVNFPGTVTWSSPLDVPETSLDVTVIVSDTSATLLVRDERTLEVIRAVSVAWNGAGDISVQSVQPAADGTVTLPGLPDGAGKLTVSSSLPYETFVLALETPAAIPTEVLLKPIEPSTVHGQIVGDDGRPLKDASFEFIRTDPPSRAFGTTKEDGAIDRPLGNPRPGPTLLVVRRAGYASYIRRNLVLRPGMNDLGSIQLQRGYRVKIIAPDDAGSDPQPYRIRVLDARGAAVDAGLDDASALGVASGGEASVGLLAPGTYTVELVAPQATKRASVTVRDGDAEAFVK